MTGRLADPPLAEGHAEESAGKLADGFEEKAAAKAAPDSRLTRRRFLLGSAAAAAGVALYSGEIARHEISVVTRPIAIDNLPGAFQGFRIVQLSDIHYDEYTEPSFVARAIGRINALAPDLVLLTGDYISFGPLPRAFTMGAMERCAEALRQIACPQRFAVMGNHDSVLGAPTIRPILAEVDIPLLVNEYAPIERAGQRLWLSGVHDPVTHVPNLHTAIPERPDGPVLLMSHAPDYADTVVTHPRGRFVDLMITGHTHGGQVRFPFVGPMHLPSGGRKYVEGLFRFDRMQLYVNRGIGTTGLPLRLNCPPEITVFILKRA
jgi:predicted MPP superfamily phosphohydrolase